MTNTDLPFAVSEHWQYRPGCGQGVRQSHLEGKLIWRATFDTPKESNWVGQLANLLDEPVNDLPQSRRIEDIARWLLTVQGAVLRCGSIATVREANVQPIQPAPNQQLQECLIVMPVASPKASMTVLKWLLGRLNRSPVSEQELQALFFELMEVIKPFAKKSSNHWRTLQAAYDEGYPVLTQDQNVACIGVGIQRRMFNSFMTDRTPHLAMVTAQNKHLTGKLLRANGFPGGDNRLVFTLENAKVAANELGYPLVVKPNNLDRGLGVSADIRSEEMLTHGFELAKKESPQVLVERFQPGFTHRFTVVEHHVLRVAKHVAFGVIGDGVSSIEQLVEAAAMALTQRKRTQRKGRSDCVLDNEALGLLSQHGLDSAHVPAAGIYVRLRRKDNVSAGGTRYTLDIGKVHADNLQLAVNVSALLGLDFAGVDLISPDVSQSWREGQAMICEINANPQLVARDDPNMYKRVLRLVLPASKVEANLLLLIAAPDPAAVEQLVQRWSPANSGSGLSIAAGIWLDGVFVAGPFLQGLAAAQSLCMNQRARSLTFVMTLDEVIRLGLPIGQLDNVFLPMQLGNQQAPAGLHQAYQQALSLLRPHARHIHTLTKEN